MRAFLTHPFKWISEHPWFTSTAMIFITIAFVFHDGNVQDRKIAALAKKNQATQVVAIDQFCLLAERDHRQDVRQLRNTYRYLAALEPHEKDDTINRFIIAQLPRTEAEATADLAPELCDQPGYGLPEPDPVIPKRPALHGFDPAPGPRPRAGEPGREASSGRLPGETRRPGSRVDSPRRPAQRPEKPVSRPSEPVSPQPRPVQPPQDLKEPPRPPNPAAPRVCVDLPVLADKPICAP